ncbi:MAG: DegV family protein [Lachnospiraceae bacterium]|nr:DegV family protein [Lachnospiraceae bacterium]
MAVRILTDSTCDLSPELVKEFDIRVIPLNIIMGDKSYRDGIEASQSEIFKWADENKTTPKTSAPDLGFAEDFLKQFKDAGDEAVYIGISEDMSSTCQTMRLAAEDLEYKDFYVVDSMNLSTGVGLQVLRASDYAKQGMSAAEIAKKIEEDRGKVRASFCIDTLTYLHRGGRCSGVAALLGAALMLKPMIAVRDGKMGVARKYRGKIRKVLKQYAEDMLPELQNAIPDRVFVTHTASDETAAEIREYVESLGIFEHVYETKAGGVISSHCGPGTLGILFYSK